MLTIESVTLEAPDTAPAEAFTAAVLGSDARVGVRASNAPTTGFRGFTLSLVAAQPGDVDALVGAALDAGATTLKPAAKSFWGYGGVVQSPDGSIWKIATSSKKDTRPAAKAFDAIVLLLGVADVAATMRCYADGGMTVAKRFGRKYVEFDAPEGAIKLALYGRRAAAKDAGVDPEGTGSHRLVIRGTAGPFTDPDGFEWETAPTPEDRSAAAPAQYSA